MKTFGIVLVVAGVKINCVVIHHRSGICGKGRLHYWIVRVTYRPQNCDSSSRGSQDEFLYSITFC